jgi:Zn-dependent protease
MIIAKVLIYSFYLNGFYGTVANNLIEVFEMMCSINISLAIFNLIPIPPFDGSRIFNAILSDKLYYKIMQYERYIFIGLLIVLYTGVLSRPLGIASSRVFRGLDKLTGFVDRLFRTFI